MTTTGLLNAWAASWSACLIRGIVESTVLIVVIGVPWLILRRRLPAQFSYGLFVIVIFKLALPIPIDGPAWLARLSPRQTAEHLAGWTSVGPADGDAASDPFSDPFATAPPPAHRASASPMRPGSAIPWPSEPTGSRAAAAKGPDQAAPDLVAVGPAPTLEASPDRRDRLANSGVGKPTPSLTAVLMVAWAAIVTGLLAGLVLTNVRMHHRLRGATPIVDESLRIDLARLHRLVGLKRRVAVFETSAIAAPAVWGWFRPRLLVPPGLAAELSPSQLSWIVLHELLHVRRGDVWVATLQRLVQAVYFFHPVAWLANRLVDVHREYACDDAALALGSVARRDCGAGLLAVVARAHGHAAVPAPALGLFRSEPSIRRRLIRLLDVRRRLHSQLSWKAIALLGLLAIVALPSVRARQDPPPGKATVAAKADQSGRTISGAVVHADGRPAVGARVWLVAASRPESGTLAVLGRTTTGKDGSFRLPAPSREALSALIRPALWAYRPGATVAWTARDRKDETHLQDQPQRLTLRRPTPIRVRILDPDGKPLPEAAVGVRYIRSARTSVPDELIEQILAVTDADGRATLSAFPPDQIEGVRVDTRHFGQQTAMIRRGVQGELPIQLRPVARVHGKYIADDPAAVRGLTVRVHSMRIGKGPEVYAEATAVTDEDGRFAVPTIAAGELSISTEAPKPSEYYAPRMVSARVAPGKQARFEIGLTKAVHVRGEVRDRDTHRPLAGASLRYFGPSQTSMPLVTTDANGRYEALALPGAGSRFVNPPQGYLAPNPGFSEKVTIKIDAEQTLPPIDLQRGVTLAGTVVGQDGKPVAGVSVDGRWSVTVPVEGQREMWISDTQAASARTDARGVFLLEGIHPGQTVTLEAHTGDARTDQPVTATPGQNEPVTLRISGANTVALSGRVVDSAGKPVPGALVEIRSRRPGRDGSVDPGPVAFDGGTVIQTDSRGEYRTPRQLRRGYAYRAEAKADGFMSDTSRWLSLGPDTAPTLSDLTLRRVREVSGRVLDHSGRGVAGVTVWQSGDGPLPTRAQTDDEGRFTLPGVIEGRFFLFADRTGYRPSWHLAGPSGTDVKITIARDDEPGPAPRRYRPPALPRPAELALVHRLLDADTERLLTRGGPNERRAMLMILMRIDPDRARSIIDADPDARTRDFNRRELAVERAGSAPDESIRLVESIANPDTRAWAWVSLAAVLPASERTQKLNLLARAIDDAREVPAAANRALKFANIGEALLDLGETGRAASILREGQALAKDLPRTGWPTFARQTVAEELASIDLDGALGLIGGMEADRNHDATLGHIAHELASRKPAEAERVLRMLRDQWPFFRDDYAQRVCYRMASVDPARALAIAARMKDYRAHARALGVIALARKADKVTATSLLREAFGVLERAVEEGEDLWNGLGAASTAAAGLLPIAEQVDARLVPELIGRTLALRQPLRSPDQRDAVAALSDAQVAAAVARYDHLAARAVLDACSADLLGQIRDTSDHDRGFYIDSLFDSAAFVDADRAVELLDQLPDPGAGDSLLPRDAARLRIARVLADSGDARWKYIESHLLHVWIVDSEER